MIPIDRDRVLGLLLMLASVLVWAAVIVALAWLAWGGGVVTRCCRREPHVCVMGMHTRPAPRFQWLHNLRCAMCRRAR